MLHRCTFEGAVSTELLARLNAYPRMRSTLDALPPKLLSISTGRPTQVESMQLETAELHARVAQVISVKGI